MDFPMINEINENTNAAKREILEAMPAAGATSAEVEAAKTAIIGAMPSGGDGMFVPVSSMLVNAESGGTSVTAVSANGKGFTDVIVYAGNANGANILRVVVDGVTVVNNAKIMDFPRVAYNANSGLYCYYVRVRFNKSISIWIDSPSGAMWTHAKGVVYFEE